ncbi:hypothetical protein SAMN04488105_1181 [Salipiger thiooxidans]|uniref:Uncharacterized protein n=1 Tax=Salipiger thiooxidans TaxID=282683 RepID=A0A1G7KCE8_9RHOB|nr:hypothetical protein SAMN04488105_1181 [Salipiger thiooxidans]
MQFPGVSPAVAPLATGHPQGLPAVPDGPPVETKVQPVAEQAQSRNDPGTGGQPPTNFWRGLAGLPDPSKHVAPPSIMQIKISAILEKQAEKLLDEARKAEAQAASTGSEPAEETQDTAEADRRPRLPGSAEAEPEDRPEQPDAPRVEADTLPRPYGEQGSYPRDNVFAPLP